LVSLVRRHNGNKLALVAFVANIVAAVAAADIVGIAVVVELSAALNGCHYSGTSLCIIL